MLNLLVTPLLLVTALCAATPSPAAVQPVKEAFADQDADDDAEEYDPVENLDPDNSVVAAGKGVGAICATSCALWAVGGVLLLIPGLGWLGALGLQILNPLISASVGWYVLQKSSQRRAPCCTMMAGAALPFWLSMALSGVAMAVTLGAAAAVLVGGAVAVVFSSANNSAGNTAFGAYLSAAFPLLMLAGVGLLVSVFMASALALGSGLSGILGVALGRALVEGEPDFHLDFLKVPSPHHERFRPKDRGRRPPRDREARPPAQEAPQGPPAPEGPVPPPPAPDEPVTPPPNSF